MEGGKSALIGCRGEEAAFVQLVLDVFSWRVHSARDRQCCDQAVDKTDFATDPADMSRYVEQHVGRHDLLYGRMSSREDQRHGVCLNSAKWGARRQQDLRECLRVQP